MSLLVKCLVFAQENLTLKRFKIAAGRFVNFQVEEILFFSHER